MSKEILESKTSAVPEEIIKKGKYKVFNGTSYETVHLQTIADQVIETSSKQFVSAAEKSTWNNKANSNHTHDDRYYKKTETYTQAQVNAELAKKANLAHTHAASDVITDTNKMFVSKTEKDRWNDTNTKAEITSLIAEVNETIANNQSAVTSEISRVETGYKNADKTLQSNITTVQSNLNTAVDQLKELIDNGGSANTALAKRVETIETTTIPAVKNSVSALDTKLSGKITALEENKANKTDVNSSITTAKNELNNKIALKADKTYVDSNLGLKANAADVYKQGEVDAALLLKADKTYVDTQLNTKVNTTTFNAELGKKANTTDMNAALAKKANITYVDEEVAKKANVSHTHTASQVTGLGNAATKNVGTASGQIPVLDSNGKLVESILPKIAINETFTADSITAAMALKVEVGDIVILNSASTFFKEALQAKTNAISGLNEEFSTYVASGKLAYLCINSSATSFEEKFRPLQSSGDTISSGEVNSALALKLDKSEFNSFKNSNTSAINLKANAADVYTKTQVDASLNNKVDKVSGKGLSTNDFTTAEKNKLAKIAENANNYSHPTGDGNLHVPATGTTNNRKFLMAGTTAGALSWTTITASHVTQDANNRFITDAERTAWNSKAEGTHTHTQYRLISDSLSTAQTKAEINKLTTLVQSTQPTSQMAGAVWIETM